MNPENEMSPDDNRDDSQDDTPETNSADNAAEQDAMADAAREAEMEAADGETPDDGDLAAEVAELKDKLLRTMAELENTRRIASREKADARKYAVTGFARDIVRVADNLGMAMMMVSDEARKADKNLDNLCVGIDMTMKELLSIFESHGIKPVPAEGQPFDHNIHEAVQQVENPDVPHNTVLQALRGGFTLQDRLLRPAQVVVSTGGPKGATGGASPDDGAATADQQAYEPEGTEPGQQVDQET